MLLYTPIITLLGLALRVAAASGSAAACESFAINAGDLPDVAVTLTRATHFAANATVTIANNFSFINEANLPAFCRLQLVITTNATAGSFALTEVWLPDAWNGRMLTLGNGALAGGVNVGDLGDVAIRQGFAGVSTNTGHEGGGADASFAGPHNDNAIIDFGFRAVRLTVLAGKGIVAQYYKTPAKKSYYLGCSSGGRQGLKEVQEFPEDFDGVVVGSPASFWTHLQAWSVHMNLNVQPATSPHFMPQNLWLNVIGPEVMRQCDELDGLKDGIINDPRICLFRPDILTCRPGQDRSTCLTIDQISALHRIYTPYVEGDQETIFTSYYPGGEDGFFNGLVGDQPFALGVAYYQFFVVNDTTFTINDFNETLLRLTDELDPGQLNAINPNITAFAGPQHNGKLIQYVGWADQLISPGASIHYYETVFKFMQANTEMNTDDFYRLFTVPGMQHCAGGAGANAFGGALQASGRTPPLSFDPQHNILAAVVRWVEEGIAPDTITAVHYNNNNVANGVGFARPLCKYPLTIKFRGGDPNSADSFECS